MKSEKYNFYTLYGYTIHKLKIYVLVANFLLELDDQINVVGFGCLYIVEIYGRAVKLRDFGKGGVVVRPRYRDL